MHRFFLLSLTILCLVAPACSQSQLVKDSWKFTTRQYREYLNSPASLDLDDKGSCEVYELALGESLLEVDAQLTALVRSMENSDNNPDAEWVLGMVGRFPWLSGVALVDKDGGLIAKYPEQYGKPFDVTPLLTPDPKQRIGDLRAYVQENSNGPEVYLANPVYSGANLRGLVVAFFDPQALATLGKYPGQFMLASSQGVLWPGNFGNDSIIAKQNWEDILKSKVCGTLGNKEQGFFWTVRYFGNLPLIYAVPLSAQVHSTADAQAPASRQPEPDEPKLTIDDPRKLEEDYNHSR